eukprot:TRINITY_DN50159_c0_g1_i1.p3 TRINITY_DN50159_c0_g1~~TRINITY_DN50159_c0_g1_i1.p3  ORF type:complete len:117 (+),score=19.35 TRINITY_DN50159_c0_g1_i1:246-596(+)
MPGIAKVTPMPTKKLLEDAIEMAHPEVKGCLTFVTAVCAALSHCSKKIRKLTTGTRTARSAVKIATALTRNNPMTEECNRSKLVESLEVKSHLIMRGVSVEASQGGPVEVRQNKKK